MIAFKYILTISITVLASNIFGQYIGYSPIADSAVSRWKPVDQSEYFGTYRFGESESESTLILFQSKAGIIAQIKSGAWNSEATDWIWQYDNLNNVTIDKQGNFYSDEYKGAFVYYEREGEVIKCLKIVDSWNEVSLKEGAYELGWKMDTAMDSVYKGAFTFASIRLLLPKELADFSLKELKTMRNEIFARYGYTFNKGGEMDTYFRDQPWYRPQRSNVNAFLTLLERKNIEEILRMENQKK